jgi:hypothetical protein
VKRRSLDFIEVSLFWVSFTALLFVSSFRGKYVSGASGVCLAEVSLRFLSIIFGLPLRKGFRNTGAPLRSHRPHGKRKPRLETKCARGARARVSSIYMFVEICK